MKRIFYFLIAALMLIGTAANAQTIENNGVFSHINIGVKGGAAYSNISTIKDFNFNALNYNAALEIGKDVTPITGFSLEGIVTPSFTDGFKVARTDVFGNVKFNLMNLFGGYKGYPRRVEIRTVTGIGWNHNFVIPNPNDIALQAGLEFDFNLGKSRNWYITFQPMVQANDILQSQHIKPMVENADVKATLGVAYRLGRHHNFKIVENSVSEEDYNTLLNKYNELMNREPEADTVYVKTVVKDVIEKVVVKPTDMFVNFKIGSATVSNENVSTLNSFAKVAIENGCEVRVIGSADTATGNKDLNEKLALDRAKNVAEALVKAGVKVVAVETSLDIDEDSESSRCAVIIAE
jgi:outer membrane protein OmpA-like peptidoglycan-associated protein